MTDLEIKQQVRQFYDQVGWQVVSEGMYQNARYEDLRPVAREYIHCCHLRVGNHLRPTGRYLLDAGSGPIQYPEYLAYSAGYDFRVCVDLSHVALSEARKRLGERGLYVVADVANLPFKPGIFDGIVSLHTLHHLPADDHLQAYRELYRVLAIGERAVIVNGWTDSSLMRRALWLVKGMERLQGAWDRLAGKPGINREEKGSQPAAAAPTGTFIKKFDPAWLKSALDGQMRYEVLVWRSVSVRFLRAVIHPKLGGKYWLRLLAWLEDRFPRYFGSKGQYPLIVIRK